MLGALGKVRDWIPWNILVGRYLTWLLLTAGPSSKEAEVAQSFPSKILVISKDFRALVTAAVGSQAVLLYRVIPSQVQDLVFSVLNSTRLLSDFSSSLLRPFWKNVILSQVLYLLVVQICPEHLQASPHTPSLCRDAKMEQNPCSHPMGLQGGILFDDDFGYRCVPLEHVLPYQPPSTEKWKIMDDSPPFTIQSIKEDDAGNWVFAV